MKNWNTDTSKFTTPRDKRIWEISQLINYGLEGKKLNESEIKKYWKDVKPLLDPERARMIEFLVWNKTYSLKNKKYFWM